jgi:hypothetical protein
MSDKILRCLTGCLFLVIFILSCDFNKPSLLDSGISQRIAVYDTTGVYNPLDSTRMSAIPFARVILASQEYNKTFSFNTDSSGIAAIDNILASDYDLYAEYQISIGSVLTASAFKRIYYPILGVDTLFVRSVAQSPIVINEIYSCGPPNNVNYFYDQYIELYNRTNEIQYLDGLIVTRVLANPSVDPYLEDWDYVKNLYAFQFPGTAEGNEYPIQSGQYVVIAGDAFDHSQVVPGAVNLENADWEFVNQLGSDFDNPNVPNLKNINPENTHDYLINLISDAVVLANGTNFWQDGEYIDIDISTILDGVEYKSSLSTPKHFTRRLDNGYAGLGISRYTGKSKERAEPGKDTNNSTMDFEVIITPTPGYQH